MTKNRQGRHEHEQCWVHGVGGQSILHWHRIGTALAQMLSTVAAAKPALHARRMPLPHALHKAEALRVFACLHIDLHSCAECLCHSMPLRCSYLHLLWFDGPRGPIVSSLGLG